MKSLLALATVLAAALVNAQALPDVPGCSLQCFLDALTTDGCSGLLDFGCHCQKPELVSKVTPCVKSSCGIPEQATVSNVVIKQCSSAGVAISIPPVGDATPTPTASATATDTASTSGASPSTTMSSSGAGAVTETSSAIGSMTLPTSSSVEGSRPGTSTKTSPSSTTQGQTPTGGAAPPVFTGDATHVKHNLAGVAAAAAAIVLF